MTSAWRGVAWLGRYKTIFIGSRLNARLLGDQYPGSEEEEDEEFDSDLEAAEEGGDAGEREGSSWRRGGMEETKAGEAPRARKRAARKRAGAKRAESRAGSSQRGDISRARQESTRELVDYFADRMQEARDAWSARVEALQKRWQASFLRGGWGVRGGGSAWADRDAALRLAFGLIVRMYAYEDALDDLRLAAEQDPLCMEAFAPQVSGGKERGGINMKTVLNKARQVDGPRGDMCIFVPGCNGGRNHTFSALWIGSTATVSRRPRQQTRTAARGSRSQSRTIEVHSRKG